jgi:hypothetical protein
MSKSGLKLACIVNIVYGNLKSENSQDYTQKPQRHCTFMNSASGLAKIASLAITYDQMIESYQIYPKILNFNLAPVYSNLVMAENFSL